VKLLFAHLKVEILELIRLPAYSVPTLIMPSLMFLMFGGTRSTTVSGANYHMASYATFAVMGIAFSQFGVGIANDRESPWQVYLRILPVSALTRFAARVDAAVVFALLSVGLVLMLAAAVTPAELVWTRWCIFLVVLLMGSIPIGLLGIALGYWAGPKSALPIANILFLTLAFAGGVFLPPTSLPKFVSYISPYLPTRMLLEVSWSPVNATPMSYADWVGLGCYGLVGLGLATAGYRKDEGRKYT
jgi:ABC-2 type transport system permease protein